MKLTSIALAICIIAELPPRLAGHVKKIRTGWEPQP
jgi:hypothetical protein